MLLTVLALLSHLALLISATPGHVPEKRESGYSHYSRSKTVSPRSIDERRSYRREGSEGGPYAGPAQIVQTATTLINVHPTVGYRKISRHHASGAGAGGNEYRLSEKHQSIHNQQMHSHSGGQAGWAQKSTSTTTTEVNMYQNGKKVVSMRADLPGSGGHMNYPYSQSGYQSHNSGSSLEEHNLSPSTPPPPPPPPPPPQPQPQYSDYDYRYSEQHESNYRNRRPPPHSVPSPPTSTTTEVNTYQNGNKISMRAELAGGHANYPYPQPSPYHYDNSYHSRVRYYNTPPPPPPPPLPSPEPYYGPASPPSPPMVEVNERHFDDLRNNYGGPPQPSPPPPPPPPPPSPPTTTQRPYYIPIYVGSKGDQRDNYRRDNTPTSTTEAVNVVVKDKQDDDDNGEHGPDGKKKYKVLICKLQQQ